MSSKKRKKRQVAAKGKTDPKKTRDSAFLSSLWVRLKTRLFQNILLSLAAPLTVCFFGPFEIYYGNMQEFLFSLGDFLPVCLLISLAVSAVIFCALALLDGISYHVTSAAITGISVLAMVQRNYLNAGINALVGDGVGISTADVGLAVINTIVWTVVTAAVIVGAIILSKKHIDITSSVITVAMVVVLFTQIINFAVISLSSDVYVNVTERVEKPEGEAEDGDDADSAILTFEGFTELADKNNVVFFLVDRFDENYYEKMVPSEPLFFEQLDGFTYFGDYTSLYGRTYPAVASILTGKENDFEVSRLKYFENIYTDGGHLRALADKGYDVNVYTEKFYAYDNAAYMSDYVDNTSVANEYYIKSTALLCRDMIRLSLSEYLPIVAKSLTGYMSTPDFNAHAVYETEGEAYSSDMKDVHEYLEDNEFAEIDAKGKFTFIHLYGCHTPIKYDLEWNEADGNEKYDTNLAIKQSFSIIYDYIDQMKALGVYDDATIVITGDHSAAISDTLLIGESTAKSETGTRVTAMLFKKSGDSGTPLASSKAQISQDELWNTIYESEGLLDNKNGESFFDIKEGVDRERRYFFQQSANAEKNGLEGDRLVEYKISGDANDPDNWEIVKYHEIGKIYK